MDVLQSSSIDLHDLLSASASSTSDPSAPLSSPDLRLLIHRLHSRSLQIKHAVLSYIQSHHSQFSEIFSLCAQSSSHVDEISDSLSALLRLFDEGGGVEIRQLTDELRSKRIEVKERKEELKVLKVIELVVEKLRIVRERLDEGKLVDAAEGVRELERVFRVPEGWKKGDAGIRVEEEPLVFAVLREEWADCFERLQSALVARMEHMVRFDQEKSRLVVLTQYEEMEFHSVLEALEIIGVIDYGLVKVADMLIKFIINPITSRKYGKVSVEEPDQNLKGTEAALQLLSPQKQKAQHYDVEVVCSMLLEVVRFVHNFVGLKNHRWMLTLGRLTWPRMSDSIISNVLSKVVPTEASKVAEFQNVIKVTEEFEDALKGMLFVQTADHKDEHLSTFARNVEVHFASKKRSEILAKARKLLLQCDFSVSPDHLRKGGNNVGAMVEKKSSGRMVEMLFQSDKCLVSDAASQLIALVHETLKEACSSSTKVAVEFYHAARDSLLLYQVIVPIKLEKQLGTLCQAAVVMHNDCLYLSQETLALAFQYRSFSPPELKEFAVFIDMSPSYRLLAEDVLERQIKLVNLNLKEALDGANGFQNTHQRQEFESAKFAMDQVVFILEKVHILWEPFLLPVTYRRAMSSILDGVFTRISEDILQLDDLAAEETLQLQSLIRIALKSLLSLFESLVVEARKEVASYEEILFELEHLIPSLCKLRKLEELLDMPLKSIIMTWENGELVSSGFTSLEVQNFVKAIFADSPLRKECLWRLESSHS